MWPVQLFREREPERLQIEIRDTGVGFEPSRVEEPKIEEKLI